MCLHNYTNLNKFNHILIKYDIYVIKQSVFIHLYTYILIEANIKYAKIQLAYVKIVTQHAKSCIII